MSLQKLFIIFILVANNLFGVSENRISNVPFEQEQDDAIPEDFLLYLTRLADQNEQIVDDVNSTNEAILKAKLNLIEIYYTIISNFNSDISIEIVIQLCNEVINTPDINPSHARYFLGEIYWLDKYGIEKDVFKALQYFQDFLRQYDNQNNCQRSILLPGPCSYRTFARHRISQINNLDAVPLS